MKRNFTFLIAAVALLASLAFPLRGGAQTRTLSDLTFTAACGGSGTATDGAVYTVTSDAAESTYDATKGIHYGTGKVAVSYLNLETSDIQGTISQIVVNASGASSTSAVLNVTVGGNAFGSEQLLTADATEYTLTGSASGTIVVAITQTSAKKALYCKSVVVTYSSGSIATSNVAMTSVANVDLTATYSGGTLTEGNDADINQGTQVTLAYTNVATGYMFSSWVITKQEGGSDVTADVLSGNTLTVPTYDINISATVSQVQQYTVTFNPGSGSCGTENVTNYQGTIITLPSATPSANCASNGWVFVGWTNSNVDEGTTTVPDPLYAASSSYTIGNTNVTLYAVFRIEISNTTQEFNFAAIADANNWSNGTAYTTVTLSPVTLTANGGGNNGKYYTSDNSWRIYNGGSVTVSTTTGVVLSITSTPDKTFTINDDGTASFAPSSTTQFTQINVGYGTYEYASSPTCNPKVATPELSLSTGTYTGTQTVTISCTTDGASIYYTLDGTDPTSASTLYEGAISISENKTLKAIAVKSGMDDSEIVTAVYTIFIPSTYSLATSVESGRHYIITNGSTKAMGMQNDNNRAAVDVEIDNGVATVSSADVYEFVINGPEIISKDEEEIEVYTIYDANAASTGFLYAASSGSNWLRTETHLDAGNNGKWAITFDDNKAVFKAQGTNSRNWMLYNTQNSFFSCYANTSQQVIDEVYLYVKNETTPQYDYYQDIAGHNGNDGKWCFIASPLTQNTAPTAIGGLVASNGLYDLYRFNQDPDENNGYKEWENYKTHTSDFVLENGKGYLYASQASTTLYFNGECNTGATKTVNLDYSGTNPDENMRGWNLVGNPFTTVAYADHSYFVMDGNGTSIVAEPVSSSTAINPFTGVFVQATATNQSVTFSKTAPRTTNNKGVINLALSQQVNRGSAMVDKAVVSFNEGDQLGKFVFMESNAKLYIPKNGKDYAIAVAEGKGEMPVNFKAQENGTYTLNIDTENVEMNYLHLVDNMTGMDVDLLQTPSYTFDATTNDYASRFRLVFSANNVDGPSTGSEAFAFYSNGEWVIGNEGEATLQVIDVNGRIVSNETINGTVATSIIATPGVYMLRLVNGNEVKTQKIVVR